MIEATGWTWGEVRALSLPRLWMLFRHWAKVPPVGVVVRALAGWKPKEDHAGTVPGKSEAPSEAELRAWAAAVNASVRC